MCAVSVTAEPFSTGIDGPITPPPLWIVVVVVGACTVSTSEPQMLDIALLLASPP